MNKIKLHWCVRHPRSGRYVFCDGISPLGHIFMMYHFVPWEDRRDITSVIQSMQQQATASVDAWEDVAFLLHEAHANGKTDR